MRTDELGYSLLEMLVVLAILGLIAVVAVPPISASIDHMRLADDARTLAGALRALHEQALNEQRDIFVTADPQAGNKLRSSAGGEWSVSGDSSVAFVPAGRGSQTFAFNNDGTASGGTFGVTHGGAEARVLVDDVTGAVEVAK